MPLTQAAAPGGPLRSNTSPGFLPEVDPVEWVERLVDATEQAARAAAVLAAGLDLRVPEQRQRLVGERAALSLERIRDLAVGTEQARGHVVRSLEQAAQLER